MKEQQQVPIHTEYIQIDLEWSGRNGKTQEMPRW